MQEIWSKFISFLNDYWILTVILGAVLAALWVFLTVFIFHKACKIQGKKRYVACLRSFMLLVCFVVLLFITPVSFAFQKYGEEIENVAVWYFTVGITSVLSILILLFIFFYILRFN